MLRSERVLQSLSSSGGALILGSERALPAPGSGKDAVWQRRCLEDRKNSKSLYQYMLPWQPPYYTDQALSLQYPSAELSSVSRYVTSSANLDSASDSSTASQTTPPRKRIDSRFGLSDFPCHGRFQPSRPGLRVAQHGSSERFFGFCFPCILVRGRPCLLLAFALARVRLFLFQESQLGLPLRFLAAGLRFTSRTFLTSFLAFDFDAAIHATI